MSDLWFLYLLEAIGWICIVGGLIGLIVVLIP